MSWTYEKDQPLITDFNAQYINIPIAYNVSFFTKNKHQMYLTLGFNSSFQIKSDEVTISGFGYKETETKYLNPVLFGYRTGLRYAYRINDILKVKCEPKLTYTT